MSRLQIKTIEIDGILFEIGEEVRVETYHTDNVQCKIIDVNGEPCLHYHWFYGSNMPLSIFLKDSINQIHKLKP